jgi:hypothetical protein
MAGRFGPRVDRGLGLPPVDRPLRASSPGSGSRSNTGRGGTYYPTVLEAYSRDSDYKRWRAGLDYWQGVGKSWGDLERLYLLRSFRSSGALPGPQLVGATYFPSQGAPEGAWTVVCRRRGALILPQPIRLEDISLRVDLVDPSQHRLVLDVASTLNSEQLKVWRGFVGDQFEDSASGTAYPQGLLPDPLDVVALTLAEVDVEGGRLVFDLSRPFMRVRPLAEKPRAFWLKAAYKPGAPLLWRADGSRFLCSSHRLSCNCPDFSGGRVADLSGQFGGSQDRFPRPAAGRVIQGNWEKEGVGYRTRWRDLAPRADRRRECKHIHAVRWSLGYPFFEPSDYELGNDDRQFQNQRAGSVNSEQIFRYHGLREMTVDRLAIALADSAGIAVDSRDTISPNDLAPAQPGRPPVLWTSQREPEPFRALADDWWVQRGTSILRVFNPEAQRFVSERIVGEALRPVIEEIEEGTLVPPET